MGMLIHLEPDSLDTAACLEVVHRFKARRGQPKIILSDNGTNFVGTDKRGGNH